MLQALSSEHEEHIYVYIYICKNHYNESDLMSFSNETEDPKVAFAGCNEEPEKGAEEIMYDIKALSQQNLELRICLLTMVFL